MKNGDLRTVSQGDMESGNSIKFLPPAAARSPKHRNYRNLNKNSLHRNFIAPDGGWGWLIVIAAGISFMVTFDVFQQADMLYRQRMNGINGTYIFYVQQATSAVIGLFYGKIFRRFTFRQISFVGALFLLNGLVLLSFVKPTGPHYLTIFLMIEIGQSLIFGSSSVIVFTYFKEKRLSAIAWMYSIAGVSPIFLPFLSTFILGEYGPSWTAWFFAGLSLQNFICLLFYQHYKWHIKKPEDIELDQVRPLNLMFGSLQIKKLNALEVPMDSSDDLSSQKSFPSNVAYPLRVPKNSFSSFEPLTRPIPKIILPDETVYYESPQEAEEYTSIREDNISDHQLIGNFHDLDLLKKFSFVNLIIGLSLIQFADTSYIHLMPITLYDLGYDETQASNAMLVLVACDLVMRVLVAIFARYFKNNNKAILLCALIGICIGRGLLGFCTNFTLAMICVGWMGLCKAIQVVFWIMILPNHVSLNKLPGAFGLQKVLGSLLTLALGSLLGLNGGNIITNYSFGFYGIVVCLWLGKNFFKRARKP